MGFVKIRFTGSNGSTAGLVVPSSDIKTKSLSDLSRLFPMSEGMKMQRFEKSPEFGSWDEAFGYRFEKENPSLKGTSIHTWFERDRAHVELRDEKTDQTIIEWWDDDVQQAVEDGFLSPKNWHKSAYDYAEHMGLLKNNPTSGFTAKGRRMEKHIKAAGSAKAPSAVVYAAAKRGVKGLVKKNPVDVEKVVILNPDDAPEAAGSALGLWGGYGSSNGKLWMFQFGAMGTSYVAYWDVGHYGLEGSLEEVAGYLADHMPGHIMQHDDPELKSLIMEVLKEEHPKKSWDEFVEAMSDGDSWAQDVEQSAYADLTYTESGYLTSYEWTVDEIDPSSEFFHRVFDKSMEEQTSFDEDDEDLAKKLDKIEAKLGKKPNPQTTLTYGQLPPRKAFIKAVNHLMPFYADLKGADKKAAAHSGYDGHSDLDADELYDLLEMLIHHWEDGDEASGDLASGIMTTVGYEWI